MGISVRGMCASTIMADESALAYLNDWENDLKEVLIDMLANQETGAEQGDDILPVYTLSGRTLTEEEMEERGYDIVVIRESKDRPRVDWELQHSGISEIGAYCYCHNQPSPVAVYIFGSDKSQFGGLMDLRSFSPVIKERTEKAAQRFGQLAKELAANLKGNQTAWPMAIKVGLYVSSGDVNVMLEVPVLHEIKDADWKFEEWMVDLRVEEYSPYWMLDKNRETDFFVRTKELFHDRRDHYTVFPKEEAGLYRIDV